MSVEVRQDYPGRIILFSVAFPVVVGLHNFQYKFGVAAVGNILGMEPRNMVKIRLSQLTHFAKVCQLTDKSSKGEPFCPWGDTFLR